MALLHVRQHCAACHLLGLGVQDDLDFTADEFEKMSYRQRIRLCKLLAERARKIAESSDPRMRASYVCIAGEWDKLADDMERLG
jgi:hypothetical protein